MSSQSAHLAQRQQVAVLPPSHQRFAHLDSLIIALDTQPRLTRRALLKLRKRMIERHIPVASTSIQGGR